MKAIAKKVDVPSLSSVNPVVEGRVRLPVGIRGFREGGTYQDSRLCQREETPLSELAGLGDLPPQSCIVSAREKALLKSGALGEASR